MPSTWGGEVHLNLRYRTNARRQGRRSTSKASQAESFQEILQWPGGDQKGDADSPQRKIRPTGLNVWRSQYVQRVRCSSQPDEVNMSLLQR